MLDLWHLADIHWLRELPAEVAETLRRAAEVRRYDAGMVIFQPTPEPEHVYLLEWGLVRMYRISNHGDEVTLGYVRPGEVFGELAAFGDKPRESYAAAVESSSILKFGRKAFSRAMQTTPSVMFSVAKQIEGRFKRIESRVEDLVFRNARTRLAHVILQLAQDFGQQDKGRTIVRLQLTQAELATLVGASRPTVSIALGDLEDEGLVTRTDGHLVITDPMALRRAAGSED